MMIYPFPHCPNKYFIETGTYYGNGIRRALYAGHFEKIYSIDLSEYFCEYCRQVFANEPNVQILCGDSRTVLPQILSQVDAPATFWLDAHYSSENTAKGLTHNPILDELEIIKNHPIKNHTIMIDDAKLFGTASFDFIEIEELEQKIWEIHPDYVIELYSRREPDDMLLATRKV
ncbi:MAG: hypothetical protein Q8L98_06730 [Chlamydiales bacterium]|nr:hypothetical protein [Chlamydiales bacterium]